MILIDKEQLIQDLYSEALDKDKFEWDLIHKYSKDGELYEDDVIQILDEFLEGVVNVIDTAEIIKLTNCLGQND